MLLILLDWLLGEVELALQAEERETMKSHMVGKYQIH